MTTGVPMLKKNCCIGLYLDHSYTVLYQLSYFPILLFVKDKQLQPPIYFRTYSVKSYAITRVPIVPTWLGIISFTI